MKRKIVRNVLTLAVLIVMLTAVLVPSVLAAYEIGCTWSIPTGSTHWNGKNEPNGLWDLGYESEKRYNVSILSTKIVSVHGSIFKVNQFASDDWITEVRFSNADTTWKGSRFVNDYGHAYYSRITEEKAIGANGRTSVTIFD